MLEDSALLFVFRCEITADGMFYGVEGWIDGLPFLFATGGAESQFSFCEDGQRMIDSIENPVSELLPKL